MKHQITLLVFVTLSSYGIITLSTDTPAKNISNLYAELREGARVASLTSDYIVREMSKLLQQNADPDTEGDDGHTALSRTVTHSIDLDTMQLLLAAKADTEKRTAHSQTPLYILTKDMRRRYACNAVVLLLQAKADVHATHRDNQEEMTPLHQLKRHTDIPDVKKILELIAKRTEQSHARNNVNQA